MGGFPTDTGTVSDVQPGCHESTSLDQVLLFRPIGVSVWKGILSAPPEQLSWPKEPMRWWSTCAAASLPDPANPIIPYTDSLLSFMDFHHLHLLSPPLSNPLHPPSVPFSSISTEPAISRRVPIWSWSCSRFVPRGVYPATVACWGQALGIWKAPRDNFDLNRSW